LAKHGFRREWNGWAAGRHATVVLSALFCLAAAADESAEKPYAFPSLTRHTFDNGLAFYHVHMPDEETFELKCTVWGGRNNEPEDRPGIAHFLEHILFHQPDCTPEDFRNQVEERGGAYNGITTLLDTYYYVSLPLAHLDFGSDWLYRVLHHDPLPLDKVETERNIIRLEKGWDGPLWIASCEKAVGLVAEPLLYPLTRDRESLWEETYGIEFHDGDASALTHQDITAADLEAYYLKWYVPANMAMVYVGPHGFDEVLEALAPRFGGMPSGPKPEAQSVHQEHPAKPYRHTCRGMFSNHVHMGHLFDSARQESRAFLLFYRHVVRELLTDVLRHKEEQTYAVGGSLNDIEGAGYVVFGFSCAREEFWDNCDRLREMIFEDLGTHLTEEDYLKYRSGFVESLFIDQEVEQLAGILDEEIEARADHAPPDTVFATYDALQDMDYATFIVRANSLRDETVPYANLERSIGWWEFPRAALFLTIVGSVLYWNARRHRRHEPKKPIWRTDASLVIKIVAIIYLLILSGLGVLWATMPLEFLKEISPRMAYTLGSLLIVPEALLFAFLWLLIGSLPSSRAVAGEDGVHIYSMGWSWRRIPYKTIDHVELSHSLRNDLRRLPLILCLRIREHTFNLTRAALHIHPYGSRVTVLNSTDAERWQEIIEDKLTARDGEANETPPDGGEEAAQC
jgi:Peptidase M16 inactive domain/Insulinase (Peptidase family M16)